MKPSVLFVLNGRFGTKHYLVRSGKKGAGKIVCVATDNGQKNGKGFEEAIFASSEQGYSVDIVRN